MLEQNVKQALGELTFQLCAANTRIEELTKQLESKNDSSSEE